MGYEDDEHYRLAQRTISVRKRDMTVNYFVKMHGYRPPDCKIWYRALWTTELIPMVRVVYRRLITGRIDIRLLQELDITFEDVVDGIHSLTEVSL